MDKIGTEHCTNRKSDRRPLIERMYWRNALMDAERIARTLAAGLECSEGDKRKLERWAPAIREAVEACARSKSRRLPKRYTDYRRAGPAPPLIADSKKDTLNRDLWLQRALPGAYRGCQEQREAAHEAWELPGMRPAVAAELARAGQPKAGHWTKAALHRALAQLDANVVWVARAKADARIQTRRTNKAYRRIILEEIEAEFAAIAERNGLPRMKSILEDFRVGIAREAASRWCRTTLPKRVRGMTRVLQEVAGAAGCNVRTLRAWRKLTEGKRWQSGLSPSTQDRGAEIRQGAVQYVERHGHRPLDRKVM